MTWFLHLVQWFWIRRFAPDRIERRDLLDGARAAGAREFPLRDAARSRTDSHAHAHVARKRRPRLSHDRHLLCHLRVVVVLDRRVGGRLGAHGARLPGRPPPWTSLQVALGAAALAAAVAASIYIVWKGLGRRRSAAGRPGAPWAVLATTAALCLLTVPAVAVRTGHRDIVDSLQSASLNRRDAEEFQRGYYENLLDVGRFNRELQQIYEKMPKDFVRSLAVLGLSRRTGDEQDYRARPEQGRAVRRRDGAHESLGHARSRVLARRRRQASIASRCSGRRRRWAPGSKRTSRSRRCSRNGSIERSRTGERDELRDSELRRGRVFPAPHALPARTKGLRVRARHGDFPRARQRPRGPRAVGADGAEQLAAAKRFTTISCAGRV